MYLFFDLDGVLVDFCELHRSAFIDAWNMHFSNTQISTEFHDVHLEAMSTKQKIRVCINALQLNDVTEEQINSIITTKQDITARKLLTANVYKNTTNALEWAKSNHHTLVCCTNSIKQTLVSAIERLECTHVFDGLLSNEDVTFPKPDPEIYVNALTSVHAEPSTTLVFEDSPIGKRAAERAGLTVIPMVDALDMTPRFLEYCILNKRRPHHQHINVVIPMAGLGSRFQKNGYTTPKPFLPVFGKPMFQWVIDNIVPDHIKAIATIHIIVREEHVDQLNALKEKNVHIHTVEKLTEGAACTVLTAEHYINTDSPLVIANSDQYLEWDSDGFYNALAHPDWDGVISTFAQHNTLDLRWSYANIDTEGAVTQVAEKKYIGPLATTGIYAWKHGRDFVKDAHHMIAENMRSNNEFYVCPVYTVGISRNLRFRTLNCKKMWGLSVPDDYEYFLQQFNPRA